MATAAEASGGAVAPSVAWRVVRAVELLFAAVGLYGFFLQLPLASAAASSVLRLAAAFSVQQYTFLLGNAIVIALFALFRRRDDDDEEASPSSPSPLHISWWWPSDGDAQADKYLPLPGPPSLMPPPPPAAITDEAGEKEIPAVFEDKEAVHVTKVRAAQPPRRSKSEKTTTSNSGAAARRRRAEPELRRGESENGRQWLVAAAEATPVESGMEVEAFQRLIEEFIEKKKTGFHLEESAAAAKAAAAGGAVVVVK
ncbi:hypothetical protein HU200_047437 [Digitaria exilis]|uniref:Uncharacterized protein n=1 Tax=Digitaria exilis TaxID=1010633 RepID=A0A835EBR5_9POAL|nr:hypothetical protein HU200_047437 [Digitaria exilis]CAB3473678.1 unnamed protein product [Digitaria exilis]